MQYDTGQWQRAAAPGRPGDHEGIQMTSTLQRAVLPPVFVDVAFCVFTSQPLDTVPIHVLLLVTA